jgi:acyl carrier protein
MSTHAPIYARITAFFPEQLNRKAPAIDVDLIQTGTLDSLGLIDLILYLEKEFEIKIPLKDLEVEDFRSVEKIAAIVISQTGVSRASGTEKRLTEKWRSSLESLILFFYPASFC